jgi:hypothetical protein
MNAAVTSLKTFACGAAALALTAVFSWSFVESTSVARVQPASVDQMAGVAVVAVAQAAQAALVD